MSLPHECWHVHCVAICYILLRRMLHKNCLSNPKWHWFLISKLRKTVAIKRHLRGSRGKRLSCSRRTFRHAYITTWIRINFRTNDDHRILLTRLRRYESEIVEFFQQLNLTITAEFFLHIESFSCSAKTPNLKLTNKFQTKQVLIIRINITWNFP